MAIAGSALEEVKVELAEIAERRRTDKGRSDVGYLKQDGTTPASPLFHIVVGGRGD